MKIEIVSTGEEVLTGAVIDSNAAYIAQSLIESGFEVIRHSCVGDKKADIVSLLKECEKRGAGAVVVTGGLGPTDDDRTAEAAGEAWGVDLVHDHAAEMSVNAYFQKMNRPVPLSNRKQMILPSGSTCLENTSGTAPGFFRKHGETCYFFIPGVPWEMKHMLARHVLPMLRDLAGDTRILYKMATLSHFGIAEAEVNQRLKEVETVFPGITLGMRAVFPVIHVKLYAQGEKEDVIDRLLEQAKAWVLERTGDYVFSTRGFSLAQEIGENLVKTKRTLALAESCTGGLIAHMITDVAGSSAYFLFSAVTYANEAKMKVLDVCGKTLESHGAVSHETVKEMAENARRIAGSDLGLSVSGIAGPTGGTSEKPVGTVYIAVATGKGTESHVFRSPFGDRDKNKKIFAMKALELLWRTITNH